MRELHVPSLHREDVRRLQVAVDIVPVEVVEPLEDLDHVRCNELLLKLILMGGVVEEARGAERRLNKNAAGATSSMMIHDLTPTCFPN